MTTLKGSLNAPRPEDVGAFWQRMTSRGGGPAKPSRFLIQITPPSFPDKSKLNFPEAHVHLKDLTFQCDATEMPGRTISTSDVQLAGPAIKLPYGTTYSDITLNFICTNDMFERKIFDDWLNYINNTTNFLTAWREDYVTTISIFQYDEGGDQGVDPAVTFGAQLIEAYPIAINPMSLAWGEDGVHRLGVTFAYTYYRPIGTITKATPIPQDILYGIGLFGSNVRDGLTSAAINMASRSLNGTLVGFSNFLGSFFR